jgi:hypothetical protein
VHSTCLDALAGFPSLPLSACRSLPAALCLPLSACRSLPAALCLPLSACRSLPAALHSDWPTPPICDFALILVLRDWRPPHAGRGVPAKKWIETRRCGRRHHVSCRKCSSQPLVVGCEKVSYRFRCLVSCVCAVASGAARLCYQVPMPVPVPVVQVLCKMVSSLLVREFNQLRAWSCVILILRL